MVIEGAMAIFGVGCGGGVLAELFHWWGLRQNDKLPDYGSKPAYWIITLAMILAGGFIAWLYFGESAEGIVALHVGISTPLILQKLVTTIPQTDGSKNIVMKPAPSVRSFFTW
jgi:hypothetical protein